MQGKGAAGKEDGGVAAGKNSAAVGYGSGGALERVAIEIENLASYLRGIYSETGDRRASEAAEVLRTTTKTIELIFGKPFKVLGA